ncbi:MAG: FAD-dependent oxidoreductase, partial [Boseongicola sp.]|nr:FAD-dependent oxidoreductase [Boseongicola sp.]
MSYDVDLFVIGGGSGGVRAARTAAATGAKVALAEDSRMGGTCVIRGCVPKKLMVFASEFREGAELAKQYGWSASAGDFNWNAFRGKLNGELDRLEQVYRNLLGGSDVTIHDARATMKDAHTVALSNGETVTAENILVATGGRPVRPDQPNAHLGMVSDDIFNMETLPKSILIIGGGYIASEFACILNGLGVEVTQYYRGAQILRGFDDEARGLVAEMMQEKGIDLHLGTNIVEMRTAADAEDGSSPVGSPVPEAGADAVGKPVWVKATNGEARVFDAVMFATGRAPNSHGLGLEDLGVNINRRGAIEVDEFSKTAVDNIYAIGDVTDRIQLTPVAIREGMAFTETVYKNNPTKPDHELVASAVFTQPELGTVGLTEEQAREIEPIDVYCTSFRPM